MARALAMQTFTSRGEGLRRGVRGTWSNRLNGCGRGRGATAEV